MSPATWISTGNEPWPFHVDMPDDLPGLHAKVLGSTLGPTERFRTLVYIPIWYGREAPFGIRGAPASHAIGLTDSRIVVSVDRHTAGAPPVVESISLDRIVALEAGSALLLGWFVLRHASGGEMRETTALHGSTGSEPVAALAREIRDLCGSAGAHGRAFGQRSEGGTWAGRDARLSERASALLLPNEALTIVAAAEEKWTTRRRRMGRDRRTCVTSPVVVGVSELGWMLIRAEPRSEPSTYAFGVDLMSIPFHAVQAALLEVGEEGTRMLELAVGSPEAQLVVRASVTTVSGLLPELLSRGAA